MPAVPAAALDGQCYSQYKDPLKGTLPLYYGLEENVNNEQSAGRRKETGIFFFFSFSFFALNEEQQEWVDKDDEEPLFPHMHTWDGRKGVFLPDHCLRRKGRGVLASSPGCQAVSLYCQSGRVAAVIRGGQLSGHLICS